MDIVIELVQIPVQALPVVVPLDNGIEVTQRDMDSGECLGNAGVEMVADALHRLLSHYNHTPIEIAEFLSVAMDAADHAEALNGKSEGGGYQIRQDLHFQF